MNGSYQTGSPVSPTGAPINRTHFEHLIVALFLMAVIVITSGDWFAGMLAPVFGFWFREHAQHTRKIRDKGDTSLLNTVKMWNWSVDSLLDFIFPLVGNVAAYLVYLAFDLDALTGWARGVLL
jgi:hypothetical protein